MPCIPCAHRTIPNLDGRPIFALVPLGSSATVLLKNRGTQAAELGLGLLPGQQVRHPQPGPQAYVCGAMTHELYLQTIVHHIAGLIRLGDSLPCPSWSPAPPPGPTRLAAPRRFLRTSPDIHGKHKGRTTFAHNHPNILSLTYKGGLKSVSCSHQKWQWQVWRPNRIKYNKSREGT